MARLFSGKYFVFIVVLILIATVLMFWKIWFWHPPKHGKYLKHDSVVILNLIKRHRATMNQVDGLNVIKDLVNGGQDQKLKKIPTDAYGNEYIMYSYNIGSEERILIGTLGEDREIGGCGRKKDFWEMITLP